MDNLAEVELRMRERRSLKIAQMKTNPAADISLIQMHFVEEAPKRTGSSPRSDGDVSSDGSATT